MTTSLLKPSPKLLRLTSFLLYCFVLLVALYFDVGSYTKLLLVVVLILLGIFIVSYTDTRKIFYTVDGKKTFRSRKFQSKFQIFELLYSSFGASVGAYMLFFLFVMPIHSFDRAVEIPDTLAFIVLFVFVFPVVYSRLTSIGWKQ